MKWGNMMLVTQKHGLLTVYYLLIQQQLLGVFRMPGAMLSAEYTKLSKTTIHALQDDNLMRIANSQQFQGERLYQEYLLIFFKSHFRAALGAALTICVTLDGRLRVFVLLSSPEDGDEG